MDIFGKKKLSPRTQIIKEYGALLIIPNLFEFVKSLLDLVNFSANFFHILVCEALLFFEFLDHFVLLILLVLHLLERTKFTYKIMVI